MEWVGPTGYIDCGMARRSTYGCSSTLKPETVGGPGRYSRPIQGQLSQDLVVIVVYGGEGGIRTLDTLLTYTHFPGVLLKPLGHLS